MLLYCILFLPCLFLCVCRCEFQYFHGVFTAKLNLFQEILALFPLRRSCRYHGYHKLTTVRALVQFYTPTKTAVKSTNYTIPTANILCRGGNLFKKIKNIKTGNVLYREQPRTTIFTGIYISRCDGKNMIKQNYRVCLVV